MSSIGVLLLLPLVVHAAPHVDGSPLPYDGDEPHSTPPFVSQIQSMYPEIAEMPFSHAAPIDELLDGQFLSNTIDDTILRRVNNSVVDDLLWNDVWAAKKADKGNGFEVGPQQNAELVYAVNSRYVCPYRNMAYATSWTYRLVEKRHEDWQKYKNGTEMACEFSLSVSNISSRRLSPHTPDKEIDLHWANLFIKKRAVKVFVVRGDHWPRDGMLNETENPSFAVVPIDVGAAFDYPEIYRAFSNLTNMEGISRFHARCEHVKLWNISHFYETLCPNDTFYGGPRAFWGKSRLFNQEEVALDLHSLLRDIFPLDQPVCDDVEVAPSRLEYQNQAFVLDKDVPSIFSVDHVKLRINHQRFFAAEPFPILFADENETSPFTNEQMFTRHYDQSDLVFSRLRGDEFKAHMTEVDKERIKENARKDCELFDNANYRAYLELEWYKRFFLWFWPSYNHVDC